MKLRNKKTGEIGYLVVGKGSDHYVVTNNEWDNCGKYNSLAELNEKWEDYEEPKSINEIDIVLDAISEYCNEHSYYSGDLEKIKTLNIVEDKLKAFKRLEEAGFEFNGWTHSPITKSLTGYNLHIKAYSDKLADYMDDLQLLFGGEK